MEALHPYPFSYPNDVYAICDARVDRRFVCDAGFALGTARGGAGSFGKRRIPTDAVRVLCCRSGGGILLERLDVDIGKVFGHIP